MNDKDSLRGSLTHDCVQVWYAVVGAAENSRRAAEFRSLLDGDEVERLESFRFEKDKQLFLVSHAMLRSVLAGDCGCGPEELSFTSGQYGKPELTDYPWLNFSLSHTSGLAVCAVTTVASVGIDVERSDREVDVEGLATSCFSERERAHFHRSGEDDRCRTFFEIWTMKEAFLKAAGIGLYGDLQGFSILQTSCDKYQLDGTAGERADDWSFQQCPTVEPYTVSIAVRSPMATINPARRWPLGLLR